MNNKLFVGGISYNMTEAELQGFFEGKELKVVSAKIITDRDTGRSRGFGFVEFETEEDATAALKFDGELVLGRPIKLSIARPMEDRPRAPRQGGSNGGGRY